MQAQANPKNTSTLIEFCHDSLNANQPRPWWQAQIAPPKGAPNILTLGPIPAQKIPGKFLGALCAGN
jgi:hypothetical protein